MDKKLKDSLSVLVFFAIGFLVLYWVYHTNNAAYLKDCQLKGIPEGECNLVEKVISDFRSANYFYIFLAIVIFLISNISRALRWQLLIEPMGYQPRFANTLSSIMVAYLSNLGIPRSGEFVRAGVLSKYENIPADKLMGTIVLDRIIDVISLLLVILLTFVLAYSTIAGYFESKFSLDDKLNRIADYQGVLGIILLLIAISFLLLWKFRKPLQKNFLYQKFYKLASNLKEGVLSIFKLNRPYAFLFHSVVIFTCYFVMTYVVLKALPATSHLDLTAGLVVFVLGTLGIVFPSPGGMGSYHFMVQEGLALYGVASADAFSMANILFFSINLFCNLLLGFVALLLLPMINKKQESE